MNEKPGNSGQLQGASTTLPPLPAPRDMGYTQDSVMRSYRVEGYSSEDMEQYARAALAARQPVGVEAIGTLQIWHFRGLPSMENTDFDYTGSLPPGSYAIYTAPPAPAAVPVDAKLIWWLSDAIGILSASGNTFHVEELKKLHDLLATHPQPAAAAAAKDDGQGMYYIQDTRSYCGNCPMWWAPNGRGYVTRLDEAGTYTFDEAVAKNRCRETDIPWPCAEIDALARRTVDIQHMRSPAARLAEIRALMRKPAAAGGDA